MLKLVGAWMPDEEADELKEKSKALGLTVSEYVRLCLRNTEVAEYRQRNEARIVLKGEGKNEG